MLCFYNVTFASDSNSHWAYNLALEYNEKGYLDKVVDFSNLDDYITKGELSYVTNKFYSFDDSNSIDEAIDVSQKHGFMFNAIPSDFVKREESCAIFCQLLGVETIDKELTFSDSKDTSSWAVPYVSTMFQENIIIGYPDNTFKPQNYLTKAEFITMLSRIKGSGGMANELPIELLDDEITDIEIGIFEYSGDSIKVTEIEDEIELESGDTCILAISLPENYEEVDAIVDDESIVNYSKEFSSLTAISSGNTEVHFKTLDDKLSKTIKIIIK
jgi:hypothetical protein